MRIRELIAFPARKPSDPVPFEETMMTHTHVTALKNWFTFVGAAFFVAGLLTQTATADVRWTSSADDAFQESRRLAKPVLVLGVSPQCAPCQRMKLLFHREAAYKRLLEKVVVLELQAESPQFSQFVARHPEGFQGTVPMVYLLTPEDNLHFVRSGTPSLEELESQIDTVAVGEGISERLVRASQARSHRELVENLQWIHRYQATNPGSHAAPEIAGLRQTLSSRTRDYLGTLEAAMSKGHDVYRSAFRTTELYLQVADYPELRAEARRILVIYRDDERTRIPVYQSMHVVRARVAEQRKDAKLAVDWYRRAQELCPESPLGKFAAIRLEALAARKATGLAKNAPK
jgi:Thioredoxin-like